MAIIPSRTKLPANTIPRKTHPYRVRFSATAGRQTYLVEEIFDNNPSADTIYVMLDGVLLTQNFDYYIDSANKAIIFNRDVQVLYGGEIIEVYSSGHDIDGLRNCLLLPRQTGEITFSEDELLDLVKDAVGQLYDVDDLIRLQSEYNRPKLNSYAGKRILVKKVEITEAGIIGTEAFVFERT